MIERKFIYKDLIDLGFKRHDMGDGFDISGYEDFYLHLEVNKIITFEWEVETCNEVRMIRYNKENIKNVIVLEDMESLKMMINFFKKDEGNKGDKPKISRKENNSVIWYTILVVKKGVSRKNREKQLKTEENEKITITIYSYNTI